MARRPEGQRHGRTTATTSSSSRSTPARVDAGIIYHYYWYRDQAESGENSDNTELYFFGNQDPGAFVSVSGAGVLEVQRATRTRPSSSSSS